MKDFLSQREVKDISIRNLSDLAKIIFKNNAFEIGEEVYHQFLGTATGTKFAPTWDHWDLGPGTICSVGTKYIYGRDGESFF